MAEPVKLFVSAGPELEPEREAIGKALAHFPINLGWEIKRTPQYDEPVDLDAVRNCDFFVLLFASDIRAPVGLEWVSARRPDCVRLAFRKEGVLHTPAGREFARDHHSMWRSFTTGQDIARQLMERFTVSILERWQEFGISAQEWQSLSAYLAQLRGDKPGQEPESEPGGAGKGGVILAPGRDLPKGGVVVEG